MINEVSAIGREKDRKDGKYILKPQFQYVKELKMQIIAKINTKYYYKIYL